MTNTKILFLNGPPASGKDTLANHLLDSLVSEGIPCEHFKLARPLREILIATVNALGSETFSDDAVERLKDTPIPALGGVTGRRLMIGLSEDLLKPLGGLQLFGEVCANSIAATQDMLTSADDRFVAVISDSGFREEAIPIAARFGAENCVRVMLKRAGTDFAGDSRSYWDPIPGVIDIVTWNDGTTEWLKRKADLVVAELANEWGWRE